MRSWSLENAVELQKKFPYTFYRPSEAIINMLEPEKATVKLIFRFEPDEDDQPAAERMWVILKAINSDGTYTGILDIDPYYIRDLKAGDQIVFHKDNIIQYVTLDEINVYDISADLTEKYQKKCFVSNQIMHDGYHVGRIYREESEDDDYTGWTIMSDYETQAYIDDYQNLQYVAIGAVLNKDDTFIHLLDEPTGSAFAKDDVTNTFYQIDCD